MTWSDDETDLKPTVLDGSGGASRTVLDQVPIETVRERSQESGPVRTILESPGTAGSGGGAWLPSALAERFRIVRTFPARGFEADVHVVVDGRRKEWVAKVYRNGITPKSDVLERIRGADRRHVVGLEEFGLSDGRWWELLEYIPHATLSELLGQDGRRGPALAKAILQQVAAALAHLHALDIVHRDLKPDNVLVRKKEPLDLVLTDFGIASIVEGASRFTRTARTLRYAPPEAQGTLTVDEHGRAQNVSEVDRSWDYWSLGMILVEVLTGCHPFDNLDDAAIGRRLATMDTDGLSEAVSDPVWRKLCRGLLRRDPDHRWGAAQVAQWLRDPSHPSLTVAAEGPPLGTQAPGFRFQGREYVTRQELAAAFSAHWEGAESIWKNRNQELRTWLEHDLGEVAVAAALKAIDLNDALNLDAQLFLAISALHPERVPRFRDRELSPEVLGQVVAKALAGDAEAGGWIERLHAAAIMRSIVSETAAAKRLRQIGEQWFTNVTEYQGLEVELRRRGAAVRSLDRAALVTFLACALPVRRVVEDLRRRADDAITADALQQDWFKRLGSGSNATAAALLVIPQVAGFAASDARARRYERNVSIYGSLARGLIGLNLGLVAGMFTAYIPGFIFYWPIRWIWDAEIAFTFMLVWVGVFGLIGAMYPWREPSAIVGDPDRDPATVALKGLTLSGIGLVGLVLLGSWSLSYVFDSPPESQSESPQVSRYSLVENGSVVMKKATGQMLTRLPVAYHKTHSEAIGFCRDLRLGGYNDWELPSNEHILQFEGVADDLAMSFVDLFGGPDICGSHRPAASIWIRESKDGWGFSFSCPGGRLGRAVPPSFSGAVICYRSGSTTVGRTPPIIENLPTRPVPSAEKTIIHDAVAPPQAAFNEVPSNAKRENVPTPDVPVHKASIPEGCLVVPGGDVECF
jgi:serine/threonine protein kinase